MLYLLHNESILVVLGKEMKCLRSFHQFGTKIEQEEGGGGGGGNCSSNFPG